MTGMLFLSREAMEDGAVRGQRREGGEFSPTNMFLPTIAEYREV